MFVVKTSGKTYFLLLVTLVHWLKIKSGVRGSYEAY